jgi:hypothetical protein
VLTKGTVELFEFAVHFGAEAGHIASDALNFAPHVLDLVPYIFDFSSYVLEFILEFTLKPVKATIEAGFYSAQCLVVEENSTQDCEKWNSDNEDVVHPVFPLV